MTEQWDYVREGRQRALETIINGVRVRIVTGRHGHDEWFAYARDRWRSWTKLGGPFDNREAVMDCCHEKAKRWKDVIR